MPYNGNRVAASNKRIRNAAGPPCTRYSLRMSGVFANRLPRKYSTIGESVSSSRYSRKSALEFFHVKYVYDIVKPSLPRLFIRLGRVNASAKKITSGFSRWISLITHSQNASGFVCGLSTRNVRTPRSIQNKKMSRHAFHRFWRSSHQKLIG